MRRTTLLAVCCALLLALAGCSGGGSGDAGGGTAEPDLAATEAAEATPAGEATGASGADGAATGSDGGDGDRPDVQAADRQLIRTASVSLRVDDYDAARTDVVSVVEAAGGYVGDASRQVYGEGNETWIEGRLTLRVPAGNYSEVLVAVEERGEVLEVTERTRDVTEQVVDLRARLESLEAERDRLRELYARANDTEEVLAVQRELSDVQTEIERLEAQLQSLERQVAYSTITIHLQEPEPGFGSIETSRWYDTPLVEAFLASVEGVVVAARAAVVLTAYALPYAVAVGVPAAALALVYRRARGRASG